MVTRQSYAPGTPSWIDLGSPDPARSATFYGGLFGWSREGPPDPGGYRMCTLGGRAAAGLVLQQGDGAWWTTYIYVDDADTTAKAVAAEGGTVLLAGMDVMDLGRLAVFTDPNGAAFSVWQPRAHIGAEVVQEHGALTWNELTTRDVATATSFYGDVFGWTFAAFPPPDGEYTVFHVDGQGVGGIMQMGDEFPPELPDHWMVYFAVDDTDASAAKAAELGGHVSVPPFDIEGVGRIAVLNGPHGEVFSIMTPSMT